MALFADVIAEAVARSTEPSKSQYMGGITILGAHFEGPWLATAKQGIHLAEHIRAPTDAELNIVTRADLGKVMVTLAPETVPVDVIADLVGRGVTVSLGHSNASHDCVLAALAAGATGFTHLYNAMSGCQGRMPGMVGVALGEQDSFAGIIVDHHHVTPYSVKLAWQTKGTERLCLVTDAMAHVGDAADCHRYFTTQITRDGNRLTAPSGALAGSCLDMHQAVLNMHRDIGVPLADAVTMATTTPANWLKAYQYGRINIGAYAHLLSLHTDLSIDRLW
jgi:N-acetylglucosamine-6-phosphate deacetylase